MNTLIKERKFFLGRLRTDPFFFFLHLPCLSRAVVRKISNKVRFKLASRHRGAKRTPNWIEKREFVQGGRYPNAEVGLILPDYHVHSVVGLVKLPVRSAKPQDDPEAYFELNRWGFLLDTLIGNSEDQQKDIAKVFDWIESHADKEDVAWETYSACERISNLLVYLSVGAAATKPVDFDRRIFEFIADSVDWVFSHIEYYGLAETNNHIINNARALVLGGVAIGNESVCQAGMKTFREWLPVMVGESGFLRERSSHYQLIVTNWVLDAWLFFDARYGANHSGTKFLKEYSQRMIDAAALLCDADGRLLGLVGDISPDTNPFYSTLRLSRLYPEFWPVSNKTYRSAEMKGGWFRISESSQHVLGHFPSGIYPPAYPTHGHCDHTSFVWIKDGVEILADMGRYRYTPDDISLLQKSALGHNVPLVNGFSPLCESLLANGLWWPNPYACARLESVVSNDSICLSHDGFSRATRVTRHTRKITLEGNGLVVVDSFDGDGHVEIQLCWNFGTRYNLFDSKLMCVSGAGGVVKLVTQGFVVLPLVCSNSGHSDGGWTSTNYGEVESSITVHVSGGVTLPVVISTRLKYTKCVA
jgi:hypothetical protein